MAPSLEWLWPQSLPASPRRLLTRPLCPHLWPRLLALSCCSCAKSFVPALSGHRTEISLLEKPAAFSRSTIVIAWASLRAIKNGLRHTVLLKCEGYRRTTSSWLSVVRPGDALGFGLNGRFLLRRVDWPRNVTTPFIVIILTFLAFGRQRLVSHDRLYGPVGSDSDPLSRTGRLA